MLTTTDAPTAAPASEPVLPYRCFTVRVKRVDRLTPHFIRVTFHSDDLQYFGTDCLDQRIKVVLPLAETGLDTFPQGGDWWDAWRALPNEQRNPFRTYTVRAVRPAEREVDVLFVSHGDSGPASSWVANATAGDEAILVGPNALSPDSAAGIAWNPGASRRLLLAGDETAAPAILAILESLPHDATGSVFIEVPDAADVLPVVAPEGVDVTWLPRADAESAAAASAASASAAAPAVYGARLVEAVGAWVDKFCLDCEPVADASALTRAVADDEGETDNGVLWDVPADSASDAASDPAAGDQNDAQAPRRDDLYAWLAGEAGAIKTLRRHIVTTNGIDRRQVAFMGYWRIGKSEI
ncbi:siderophore-interacting protein [Leifsonia sp. ALI-44-B]|uniref:siderophore-interacting protein n=1 Tax=Leifsonia sp. ALI-44-B TaxID=1933776 RepID=UPI0015C3E457|nr:siderophore-interacting protein [Leifsonia sp. ALI-44-B]